MDQLSLMFCDRREPHFGGSTFDRAHDGARLLTQLERVYLLMRDGWWHTLREITAGIEGGSEAGVSARLRQIRAPKSRGGMGIPIERRRVGEPMRGVWEYRMVEGK